MPTHLGTARGGGVFASAAPLFITENVRCWHGVPEPSASQTSWVYLCTLECFHSRFTDQVWPFLHGPCFRGPLQRAQCIKMEVILCGEQTKLLSGARVAHPPLLYVVLNTETARGGAIAQPSLA